MLRLPLIQGDRGAAVVGYVRYGDVATHDHCLIASRIPDTPNPSDGAWSACRPGAVLRHGGGMKRLGTRESVIPSLIARSGQRLFGEF